MNLQRIDKWQINVLSLATPFAYNNVWYYSSVGDPNYPPDKVSFYELTLIEDKVLPK